MEWVLAGRQKAGIPDKAGLTLIGLLLAMATSTQSALADDGCLLSPLWAHTRAVVAKSARHCEQSLAVTRHALYSVFTRSYGQVFTGMQIDEIRDAARARELLKVARDLAKQAENEDDADARKRLEADARRYLSEARQLRQDSFKTSKKYFKR